MNLPDADHFEMRRLESLSNTIFGVAMTLLTPITKVMASMPLALLDHPPQNALAICFGMGTTHRSCMS